MSIEREALIALRLRFALVFPTQQNQLLSVASPHHFVLQRILHGQQYSIYPSTPESGAIQANRFTSLAKKVDPLIHKLGDFGTLG
jgi:hypothetical protein